MSFPSVPEMKPVIPKLGAGEKYHSFISHCSADLEFSLHIRQNLEKWGFKCFHHDRDFQPGATIISNITKGITESSRVVAIISPDMMNSSWVEFEIANSRTKAHEKQQVTFIPVLYNITPEKVPAYIKEINYLESADPEFWNKLVRAISESIPLTATIPAGNIAHGIAWSYYYGYLSFLLPGLVDRTMKSEFAKVEGIPILPKMVIVLPESCKCPADIKTVDENIVSVGEIGFKASRAGKIDRDYKSGVCKVKDPESGEEFYVIMEYATPLMSMYEMEQGRIANLDTHEKRNQMMLFKEKMEEIINHPSNHLCHGKAVFLQYKDYVREGETESLASFLARRIKEELRNLPEELRTKMEQLSMSQ